MRRLCFFRFVHFAVGVLFILLATNRASAVTVWSGFTHSFTRDDGADPNEAQSQDRITSNVWISRESTGGIFNAVPEFTWVNTSPADTEWATAITNPGKTIAATNYSDLSFTNWITAYGGTSSQQLPTRLTTNDAVVHLITDDIYLDLRFTAWTKQGGGGFSYLRAAPAVPEPATALLALMAGLALIPVRLRTRAA